MKGVLSGVILFLIITLLIPYPGLNAEPGQISVDESRQLTEQAIKELDAHNFKNAYQLIMEAVKLDPSNETAKNLYVNLNELIELPGHALPNYVKERGIPAVGKERVIVDKNAAGPVVYTGKEKYSLTESEFPMKSMSYLKLGLMYSMGESNFLNYVDSDVRLLGLRAEAGHYFNQTEGRLGLSADYTGYFVKIQGDQRIDFTVHRLNAFLLNRNNFFPCEAGSLIIGFRAGYHYYMLQNKTKEGAYYFKELNGPALGVFFSEPLFFRLWENETLKSIGLEGGLNCVPMLWMNNPVMALEYNVAFTYNLERIRFSMGWRSYQIDNGKVRERFSDIELSTEYRL
jgi:hypothetical protein